MLGLSRCGQCVRFRGRKGKLAGPVGFTECASRETGGLAVSRRETAIAVGRESVQMCRKRVEALGGVNVVSLQRGPSKVATHPSVAEEQRAVRRRAPNQGSGGGSMAMRCCLGVQRCAVARSSHRLLRLCCEIATLFSSLYHRLKLRLDC